jgi:cyclic pyranopterin phosphate synthase
MDFVIVFLLLAQVMLGLYSIAFSLGHRDGSEMLKFVHWAQAIVTLEPDAARGRVVIEARVRTRGRTGAEMEALVAVATAALTVYDMVKAVERGVRIEGIRLTRKSGGKSGTYRWNGR